MSARPRWRCTGPTRSPTGSRTGSCTSNLRGFDPASPAVDPGRRSAASCDALQRPAQAIPAELEAQAALYRSPLAGRRVLIMLDNARDAAQVRPLLPGTPGCLVLVTSRRQLTSLVVAEGAHRLTLDLLTRTRLASCWPGCWARRVAAEPRPPAS